jgi:hypothetical protein
MPHKKPKHKDTKIPPVNISQSSMLLRIQQKINDCSSRNKDRMQRLEDIMSNLLRTSSSSGKDQLLKVRKLMRNVHQDQMELNEYFTVNTEDVTVKLLKHAYQLPKVAPESPGFFYAQHTVTLSPFDSISNL